ncbi:ankyrin [Daldinia vernicosa]|uniref:ankyrin n=1 Tax=Daldinia vernicosa TaxID=114800 RepID=UPI0020081424|nr:ankyrin [Daldinia vernicosa]KAI0850857.1 ankyrin [Daldinia vernicosa]
MASRTRKIPSGDWERHKETILSLYLTSDFPGDELVQAMEKDHGFVATISQFEAQLRVWNARKNLKKDQWEVILPKIDNLSSRDIQARVMIAGHPVSTERIRRAKRYFKGDHHPRKRRRVEERPGRATNNVGEGVAIEVQDSDGNWTPYIDVDGEDNPSQQPLVGIDEIQEFNEQEVQVENHSAQVVPCPDRVESLTLPDILPELSSSHTMNLITYDQFTNVEDQIFAQTMSFQGRVAQSPMRFEPDVNVAGPALEFENFELQLDDTAQFSFWSMFLKDLPFERFERGLLSKGLQLMHSPPDCRLLSGPGNRAMMFLLEAVTAMTNANGKSVNANAADARLTLQTLDTLLPNQQLDYGNNEVTSLSQKGSEVEMCRILLFSAANGFSGMKGIPLEVLPKFLEHNSNVIKLLPRLFHDKPNHVTKALAENLFPTWIESGDYMAIRLVLKTGLVDVNKICCFVEGEKYTPLERLAKLQNLRAIHELLQFKVDVNRKFSNGNIYSTGALEHLIEVFQGETFDARCHSTFPQDWLDTVDALIRAGAEVQVLLVRRALQGFVQMDLAKKLLNGLKPAQHSDFISEDYYGGSHGLDLIARNFTDEEAEKAFTKIVFDDCERSGCKQCLSRYPKEINWAICTGASRGYIQLVRSYFQYAEDSAAVLAAAIEGGCDELVEFLLTQNPDMHPTYNYNPRSNIIYQTPLSSAIEAENATLVRELESRGALEHLDKEDEYRHYWYEFSAALSAAAGVGNLGYMKKLLALCPKIESYGLDEALKHARENNREGVVQFLLDAGVSPSGIHRPEPISERFIRAYGNKSLLSNLISDYPDFAIGREGKCDVLRKDLESGNMDMLNFFIEQSVIIDRKFLTDCLRIAVEQRNGTMLRRLLELGADIFDEDFKDSIFCTPHIDMLRILFERASSLRTCIPLFGTRALVNAIETSVDSVEVLDLFINCKATDLKSTIARWRVGENEWSPLGAAIVKEAESRSIDFPLTGRLLDANCDINGVVYIDKDKDRFYQFLTPLLVAIEMKNQPLVRFLIGRGAQVNKKATGGIRRTPIQAAAEKGSLDMVKLLLRNGADVNNEPATFDGRTALQCAAMSGNCNIAALLLDYSAKISALPSPFGGRWPIEAAAENGRLDMIEFLWNVLWNASGIGFPVEQCRKAIRLAKENGYFACADLIRELAVSNGIMLTLEGSE